MSEAACSLSQDKIPATTVVCPDGSQPRVLLAEDSMAARVLTAALLRRMGCRVDAVEHGEDAVSHVQVADYDVVLMDIEMPVMDGLIAAREIRSLGGAAAKTPIVALSAFVADSQKTSAWRGSFDHSLPKPAGREQLRGVIEAMLGGNPDSELNSKERPGHCGALVDQSELSILRDQMPAVQLKALLETACAELTGLLELLNNSVKAGDVTVAQQTAHKIRGVAASFAAPRVAELAAKLEHKTGDCQSDDLVEIATELSECVHETVNLLSKCSCA